MRLISFYKVWNNRYRLVIEDATGQNVGDTFTLMGCIEVLKDCHIKKIKRDCLGRQVVVLKEKLDSFDFEEYRNNPIYQKSRDIIKGYVIKDGSKILDRLDTRELRYFIKEMLEEHKQEKPERFEKFSREKLLQMYGEDAFKYAIELIEKDQTFGLFGHSYYAMFEILLEYPIEYPKKKHRDK